MKDEPEAMVIKFVRGPNGKVPKRAHEDDAGFDLFSSESTMVPPRMTMDVKTEVYVSIPKGWFGHIVSRSSTMPVYGLVVVPATHTERANFSQKDILICDPSSEGSI